MTASLAVSTQYTNVANWCSRTPHDSKSRAIQPC